MKTPLQIKLEALLTEAAANHHKYETNYLKGERDEDWAAWYATFLNDRGLNMFFPEYQTIKTMAYFLEWVTDNTVKPEELTWTEYAAQQILEKFSNSAIEAPIFKVSLQSNLVSTDCDYLCGDEAA